MSAESSRKISADLPVWIDPDRMSGVPCFYGTRVPVESLFTNLESGLSLK